MTILSASQITKRIFEPDPLRRLVITPIIDFHKQIGDGTVDIRLGTRFILFRGRKIETLDPSSADIEEKIRGFQDGIYVPYGDKFILHPRQFILGSSLEYIRFPSDIMGFVVGRSSWGRLGLIIETSPIVHPNFTGVLTFEFSNLSTAPIALYPGMRIAQLEFHQGNSEFFKKPKKLVFNSRYKLSTGPEFSKIINDEDIKLIGKLKDKSK